MKRCIILLALTILLSSCNSVGDNPFEPPDAINIERGKISISLIPAFNTMPTDSAMSVRVSISGIPVNGIYCVHITLTAPDGFIPQNQEQSFTSITDVGTKDIDFNFHTPSEPIKGSLNATVTWSDVSSCNTTVNTLSAMSAISVEKPWIVTVQLDTTCLMQGDNNPKFGVSTYEIWRFSSYKQSKPPYTVTFQLPPTPSEYLFSAQWFCNIVVGSLPKSAQKTVSITESGQMVILSDKDETTYPTNTPLVSDMLGTIEASAQTPTPEKQETPTLQPSIECDWHEKIVGMWVVPSAPSYGLDVIEFKKNGDLSGSIHYPPSPEFDSLWQGDYEGTYYCLDNENIKIVSSVGEIIAKVDISKSQHINAEALKLSVIQDSMTNGEKTEYEFWLSSPPSNNASNQSEQNTYFPIEGCAASRLHKGDKVTLTSGTDYVTIRSTPDTHPKDNKIGRIYPGEIVEVISKPKCSYGWLLWKIRTGDGVEGWIPETDGNEFWLEVVE